MSQSTAKTVGVRKPRTASAKTGAAATRAPGGRQRAARAGSSPAASPAPAAPLVLPGAAAGAGQALFSVARQLRGWADTVLSMAGPATDMAFALASSRVKEPGKKAAIEKAGTLLRRMRESAGLSAQELARAADLSDPELIAKAEGGKIALPFELILRFAGVLGRSDPITAAMRLTRAYNPELWKSLEALGVGRLVLQAGRERELANVYRANDKARDLSDEDFAEVLAFTRQAFDLAVDFRRPPPKK